MGEERGVRMPEMRKSEGVGLWTVDVVDAVDFVDVVDLGVHLVHSVRKVHNKPPKTKWPRGALVSRGLSRRVSSYKRASTPMVPRWLIAPMLQVPAH
jgi:hypothetical protein